MLTEGGRGVLLTSHGPGPLTYPIPLPPPPLANSHHAPRLLSYAHSALLFSDAGVDTNLITWNHVILLHGPPGACACPLAVASVAAPASRPLQHADIHPPPHAAPLHLHLRPPLCTPAGTGKTSLCKALAQKLAIRLSHRFASAQLIEINAHSLFSRWFSESGKLVTRLFAHITEMVDEGASGCGWREK